MTSTQEQGFSLIELLIAVVVFSIGLLSIAGLQTVSKKASYEALQRTTASHVAHGFLEDMRTNGDAIDVYMAAGSLGGGSRGTSPPSDCGAGGTCNSLEKAAYDLWFWEQVIDGEFEQSGGSAAGGLLMPTLCVQGPVGAVAGIFTITIVWRGSASLTANANNNCGADSGNYGDNNELRRLVQIPTYIDPAF